MADQVPIHDQEIPTVDRAEWVRPEVSRMRAGDAEAVGASGNDGVIGTS